MGEWGITRRDEPLELPSAGGHGEHGAGGEGEGRTFPDAGPEDVAVIDVHHDPLAIEGVLVDGAAEGEHGGEEGRAGLTCSPGDRCW